MNPFYIYALKDPRCTPAVPFYIGKGTGVRAWEHTLKVDQTRKGQRIAAINESGHTVVTTVLADHVTEHQALKLEAELISAFGTESTGGTLANSVIPAGSSMKVRKWHTRQSEGVLNSDAANALGPQSDYLGGPKDYLSWSVLGIVMREERMTRVEPKKHKATTK